MTMPEWLEKAEKFAEKPADGRQYRVVAWNKKSWYIALADKDIAQRTIDLERARTRAAAKWEAHAAWDNMSVEEKLEKLRPARPRVAREVKGG